MSHTRVIPIADAETGEVHLVTVTNQTIGSALADLGYHDPDGLTLVRGGYYLDPDSTLSGSGNGPLLPDEPVYTQPYRIGLAR